jgi:hypothetical protein
MAEVSTAAPPPTPEDMAVRVLKDARRAYGDKVEVEQLQLYAEAAVADLWRDSIKVTTFVPVLAMRLIREMLEDRQTA